MTREPIAIFTLTPLPLYLDSTPLFMSNTPRNLRTPRKPIKRGRGRPPKVIDPRGLRKVIELASKGCHEQTIAAQLGMHADTFRTKRDSMPELAEAIRTGRAKWHDECVRRLSKHAEKSFVPDLFFLKTRFGYREVDTDVDQRPLINIVLPGSMTPEQWIERRKMLALDNAPPVQHLERDDD